MGYRIIDGPVDQGPTVRVDSPIGYPEIGGWRATAKAGRLGIEVLAQEDVDPTRFTEMRDVRIFAAWAEIQAKPERQAREALEEALASIVAYDPAACLPQ